MTFNLLDGQSLTLSNARQDTSPEGIFSMTFYLRLLPALTLMAATTACTWPSYVTPTAFPLKARSTWLRNTASEA